MKRMSRLETIVVAGLLILPTLSACGQPPDFIPEGIYGHPGDEDDQFEVPDNLTPIDFVDKNGQSRRKGT